MDESSEGVKQFRGPDKGKGGRVLGPDGKFIPSQKGGKKGRPSAATSSGDGKGSNNPSTGPNATEMTGNQKRYKSSNKAKLANHHRKDRAVKKGASGM